jgi:hypothetical protein
MVTMKFYKFRKWLDENWGYSWKRK